MKTHLKSILTLTVVCVVIAVSLAGVNYITYPIIEKSKSDAANAALLEVMPEGKGFKAMKKTAPYILPETVTKVYSEEGGGFVFELTTTGYASGLVIICGVDKNGVITGAKCLSSNETNKAEIKYGENFKSADLEKAQKVDTIANSTKTTTAYKNAIIDAINSAKILKGEAVDIRSEEEKLSDSLKELLPLADDFEEEFLTVKSGDIKAVYRAKNEAGYVLQIGESLLALDKNFKATKPKDEKTKDLAESYIRAHTEQKQEEIDLSQYENIPAQVEKAFKTKGVYIFELKAAGFGIKGDSYYNPSGEYIKIKLSITKDGEIIDCLTVCQKESANYGAACGEPKFYKQFRGKNKATFKEVDAISGATITTNGYLEAIGKAFDAANILKGGA